MTDELLREVAQKFRDTFAGILLLCSMNDCPDSVREAAQEIVRAECQLRVMFWLCQCPIPCKKMRGLADILNQRLKKLIRLRNKSPFVYIDLNEAMIPGIQVTPI